VSVYQSPVSDLLRVGDPTREDATVDYSAYGFGMEHVPELIRMMTDAALNEADGDSDEVWAPLHAWRVLGELRAEAAITPLLGLLDGAGDDDWIMSEVPGILADIGPAMLLPAAAFLADPKRDAAARAALAEAIADLGEAQPGSRDPCVAVLIRQLERYAEQPVALNDALYYGLLRFKAVEAAPLMEKAFASGCLDESLNGDWEDAQILLGLRTERETERKPNKWTRLAAKLYEAAGVESDENDPFFMVVPDTSLARLRFTQGPRAGQVWEASLGVCSDPMCPCWLVGFACWPEGRREEAPLMFDLCANDRHLVKGDGEGDAQERQGEAFGQEVVAAFRDRDWDRLAEFCVMDKEAQTETVDVRELAGQFPEAYVGADRVRYEEVFPFAHTFMFACGGQTWMADDFYCIDRKCGCTEVSLGFLAMPNAGDDTEPGPAAEGGLVRYDYRRKRDEVLEPGHPGGASTRQLLDALMDEYPKFRETAAKRHADLRFLNEAAMQQQGLLQPVVRETPKVGRNDPCPCGSGKKYKKCCGV
jgi:hypothetical protein